MAVLMHVLDWPSWRTGLSRIDHLSDQPILAASSWIEEWHIGSRDLRLSARLIEAHAPTSLSYLATGDGLAVRISWRLQASGKGTRITQSAEARPIGLRSRLGGFPKLWLGRNKEALENLGPYIEANDDRQMLDAPRGDA